ncbi:MAG: PTS sugar transporter subunit IIC [Gemmatimonadales bacterium]|nr:PTS sugar transporter subunit IIC [Gemmatimonadales bacterium]
MTEHYGWLLVWGTLVGLDLATVGQVMIARPFVAGTVAGMILGDPLAGGTVGMVLELFALDVLPVGVSRYPDYGIGAVAAAATAAGSPGALGTGIAVCVGLVVAYLGELGIRVVRDANTRDVRRHREDLDAGRLHTIRGLHFRGLLRDLARSMGVTLVGLALAVVVYLWPPVTRTGAVLVTLVLIGASIGAATSGVLQAVERSAVLRWFGLGLVLGTLFVVIVQ